MTVVSSKEFVSNHNKYFGLAMQGPLFIRRGGNVFQVSIANGKNTAFKNPMMIFAGQSLRKRFWRVFVKTLIRNSHFAINECIIFT